MYIPQNWYEKGIYYISDLYRPNGQIMSYELKNFVQSITVYVLQYHLLPFMDYLTVTKTYFTF